MRFRILFANSNVQVVSQIKCGLLLSPVLCGSGSGRFGIISVELDPYLFQTNVKSNCIFSKNFNMCTVTTLQNNENYDNHDDDENEKNIVN
jgi:hypothetical protein